MGQVKTDMSDAELWSLVLDENGEAFGMVFDRYRDHVFIHARRLVRSSHEAEDVSAIVFLESWRCRKKVKLVNGALLGWLLATTNNVARNHIRTSLRYRRLMAKLPPPIQVSDHGESVAESVDRENLQSEVQRAFDCLAQKDKEILALSVLEELPMSDVAVILNVPLGTVKSRLSRAKSRLAALLGDDWPDKFKYQIIDGRLP